MFLYMKMLGKRAARIHTELTVIVTARKGSSLEAA